MADIERRARAYGLPPMRRPDGIDARELQDATEDPAIKRALRDATDAASELGSSAS